MSREDQIEEELTAAGWEMYAGGTISDENRTILQVVRVYKKAERIVRSAKPTLIEVLEDVLAQTKPSVKKP